MANVKLVYGSTTETCWNSTNKVTTPSLILNDNGTTRYTPLFSGSAGGTATSGDYKYTLGHLIVGGKRCALSQTQYKKSWTISGSCYVDVTTSTYTTTSGSGTSAITTTHYRKTYDFFMFIHGSNSYSLISYINTNRGPLQDSSHDGSHYYTGSWSEESTSGYPEDRDTVFSIKTLTSVEGYTISDSYQDVASGSGLWAKPLGPLMTINGTK